VTWCCGRWRAWLLVSAVALVIVMAGLVSGVGATPAQATGRWDPSITPSQVAAARTQAQRLRTKVNRLQAQQDIAEERLGYLRDQLAAASTRAISADQQLQLLTNGAATAHQQEVNRIRAIYMAGGAPALYSSILGGTSLSDVVIRIATVDQVLTNDATQRVDAATAAARSRQLHAQLQAVARARAQLAGKATVWVERLQRLKDAQQQALDAASATVKQLAAQLQQQQQAAAQVAAQAQLQQYGLLSGSHPAGGNPYADAAIAAALTKLGDPYVWGAEGPNSFDCSGLVQWAYAQAGLSLPRLANDQYFAGTPVPLRDLKPGDLLVYAYNVHDASTIHHITMYIGNGMMVEAPHTGAVVHVVPVYLDGFYGAARPGLRG